MTSKEVHLDYSHHDTQTNTNQTKTITFQQISGTKYVEIIDYEKLYNDVVKILNTIKRATVLNDDDIKKIDLIFSTTEEYNQIKGWLKDDRSTST